MTEKEDAGAASPEVSFTLTGAGLAKIAAHTGESIDQVRAVVERLGFDITEPLPVDVLVLDELGPHREFYPPVPDPDDDSQWAQVLVRITRTITVHVPRAAIPDSIPTETPLDPHRADIDFVTVVADLVPEVLSELDPDDFGEITQLMLTED